MVLKQAFKPSLNLPPHQNTNILSAALWGTLICTSPWIRTEHDLWTQIILRHKKLQGQTLPETNQNPCLQISLNYHPAASSIYWHFKFWQLTLSIPDRWMNCSFSLRYDPKKYKVHNWEHMPGSLKVWYSHFKCNNLFWGTNQKL